MTEQTNIFELVKDRINIVDALGRILQLKRVGSRWVSLCPFHKDSEPSFYVNEDRQNFRCFGCGANGDVISFYERHYNLTSMEAVEKLAAEYGIELPERGHFTGKSKKDPLYDINSTAGRYYYKTLKDGDNPGSRYLQARGISDETRRAFALGYAPGGSHLAKQLIAEGAPEKLAAELGLIHDGKDGGYYDRYRNRLIFPILNTMNKVVGFGARAIAKDDQPKYLNSAESVIFSKKRNLYGIHLTKDAIREAGYAILVEGYMDAIALYQFGVRNVTATLGTALTPEHARLLKRFAENVVLAFDADAAGVSSALKGIDILRGEGLSVKVLVVSDQKDPDEFIRKHGKDAFLEAVGAAMPAIDFMLLKVREGHDLTAAEGSVDFLKEAVGVLKKVSPVEADYYIRKLSVDTGISEGAIRMETWGKDAPSVGSSRSGRTSLVDDRALDGLGGSGGGDMPVDRVLTALQRNFIALAVHDPAFLTEIRANEKVFVTPIYARIYQCLSALMAEDAEADILRGLEDGLEEGDWAELMAVRGSVMIGESPKHQLRDCIDRLELFELDRREKEILDILKFRGDDDELSSGLTEELCDIQNDKLKLKGGL